MRATGAREVATRELLLGIAKRAAAFAYSPYSGIRVGAAVLTSSGRIFSGCNVENGSYGLTVCAERVAVQNMVAANERSLKAIAVHSPDMRNITPCGACRQVIAEFAAEDALVHLDGGESLRLSALLPGRFTLKRRRA
jgi:cytidine deaminase